MLARKRFSNLCAGATHRPGPAEPAKPSPACLPPLSGAVHIRPRRALEARGPTPSVCCAAHRLAWTGLTGLNRLDELGFRSNTRTVMCCGEIQLCKDGTGPMPVMAITRCCRLGQVGSRMEPCFVSRISPRSSAVFAVGLAQSLDETCNNPRFREPSIYRSPYNWILDDFLFFTFFSLLLSIWAGVPAVAAVGPCDI